MLQNKTLGEIFRHLIHHLGNLYVPREAKSIAYILLEEVSGYKKHELVLNFNAVADDGQVKIIGQWLELLMMNMPLQYVMGKAWFMGLELKVNPSVLIPRPETEQLVSLVIEENLDKDVKILDVGTGSGCIAIALKKNLPLSHITAIDINIYALNTARENAAFHDAKIEFALMDFLDSSSWEKLGVFDLIISNPPYVREMEKEKIKGNVLNHEPHSALFVPDHDPLLFYKKTIEFAELHLSKDGKIYFEINEYMGNEMKKLEIETEFKNTRLEKDFNGRDRFWIMEK